MSNEQGQHDFSTAAEANQSADNVVQGITALLGPVVFDMDKAIIAAKQSQNDLGKEIERLIAELELFTDIAEPPRLQPAMDKLNDARRRLQTANKAMQQTQARVDRIETQLASMGS
ncbi:hypothetical protein BCR43DRAFT_481937 [Syncephalastrum racemosum]|uniref:Biogenesis of lysosome-related organelles complex 1 subunit 7 n=1 Tax=Syncephalastrum racemosum TaxID=13706 RepID=A0A1X2HSU5_SYNRA|nr:hypothetical protein BCR43DRAFT_481937 [Syncephalastrum racemosum]